MQGALQMWAEWETPIYVPDCVARIPLVTWLTCLVGRASLLGVTVKRAAALSRMRRLCGQITLLKDPYSTLLNGNLE